MFSVFLRCYFQYYLFLQASKDFLKGMGLGLIADQLADLKLGELLNTPPPGLDEAVAIGKVQAYEALQSLHFACT